MSGPVDELKADADSHIAGLSQASSGVWITVALDSFQAGLCEVHGMFGGWGDSAVLSLSFNPKQRKLLAVGDSRGRVHVWRLGWRLSHEQPGEQALLARFMQTSTATE